MKEVDRIITTCSFLLAIGFACVDVFGVENPPDVLRIPPDLENPSIVSGDPAPGKLVLQSLPAYAGTDVSHALYLHSTGYALRDIPERKQMRDWMQDVLRREAK